MKKRAQKWKKYDLSYNLDFDISDPIANATLIIADQGAPLTLNCPSASPDTNITWIKTIGKEGAYIVEADNRIQITNGGQSLVFGYIVPADEEFYICGTENIEANSFQSLGSYLLYVRSEFISLNTTFKCLNYLTVLS